MKYADILQFDPIFDSVIQLKNSDEKTKAKRLIETFVISERMSKQLHESLFSQLQFDTPRDNKGMFIVGNYGTGKSHLMAVVSAIAEFPELVESLTHPGVLEQARTIAGRFLVVRAELNTQMPLYQHVMETLQAQLATHGVHFDVLAADKVRDYKDVLASMMAEVNAKFPNQGVLFVVDEVLDYLRANKEEEFVKNLSFLRSIGEFCKDSRFRFIAGVQESLFDSTRFQFAADSLRRIKDRFEQLRIAREDVAYVVEKRILNKNSQQQALVREHLTKVAPLYSTMNERMDEFVRLFPVHPAYIETFERISTSEKREVLKTISTSIQRILQQEVPAQEPGIIAYDSYWQTIKENPSFRAIPDFAAVIDKSSVLEAKIQQSFTRPQYRPMALRIIHALSVHRLTTSDINVPIGVTAEELRDDLCVFLESPERTADFLKTSIETVLKEIVKTVNGQFLSSNSDNGQYYLDIKKDIDFDSLISQRGESLSPPQLNRAYFDSLRQVILETPDATSYVSGHRIWEHEVEWWERKVGRSGYLFFGAPNERSTAQPPRDFYIYFLQPFEVPDFKDERKPDEVFFRLTQHDDAFASLLKLYAGAQELAATAASNNKKIYADKALLCLRELNSWYQQQLQNAYEVTYQGNSQNLRKIVQTLPTQIASNAGVRNTINAVASHLLSLHFSDIAPDYPIFETPITRTNRAQAVQDALRWIAGSTKSQLGFLVLRALEMLEGERLQPRTSRYAKHILELLQHKGTGQVLNRAELIQPIDGIEYWTRFRLEPEFLLVVLAGLVDSGDIVWNLSGGKKMDANSLDQLTKLSLQDMLSFRHIERPQEFPLPALQELFDLLGISKGLIVNPAHRDEAVVQCQGKVAELVNKIVQAQAQMPTLVLWGKALLSEPEQAEYRQRMQTFKSFLESLQAFNTAGKLKNFPHDSSALQKQRAGLVLLQDIEELTRLVQQIGPITAYLSKAEALLQDGHPWLDRVREQRALLTTQLTSPKHRADPSFQRTLAQTLSDLKHDYQDAYLESHTKARLGVNDDQRKAKLSQDFRLKTLRQLAGIEMMPKQQLREFENSLLKLKTCFSLTKQELDADPLCSHCSFRPVEESFSGINVANAISVLDNQLDKLLQTWTQTLLTNLQDPTVADNITLLTQLEARSAVQTFLSTQQLPNPVNPAFIKALQEVLSGLEKVVLHQEELQTALLQGGTPCTIGEIKQRFDNFLSALSKGKDPARVRVIVEK